MTDRATIYAHAVISVDIAAGEVDSSCELCYSVFVAASPARRKGEPYSLLQHIIRAPKGGVFMQISGIYQITNTVNGKRYVGSAANFARRWRKHRNDAIRGKHHSFHFQSAWNKYGGDVFKFEIISLCDIDDLLEQEQSFVDKLSPEYNIAKVVAAPMKGMNHPPEVKEKIAASKRGKKRPPEVVAAMSVRMKGKSAYNKGMKMSPEICANNSAAQMGKTLSHEHRRKISEGGKGLKRSKECAQGVSRRMMGNKNWLGKKHTDEWKENMSRSMTRLHEHNGSIYTSKEWGTILGISWKTFNARLIYFKDQPEKIYVPKIK